MAHIQTAAAPRSNIFAQLARGIFNGLTLIAESNGRYKQVQYLQSLSDEELAAKGMTRETIVQTVYRDMFYT